MWCAPCELRIALRHASIGWSSCGCRSRAPSVVLLQSAKPTPRVTSLPPHTPPADAEAIASAAAWVAGDEVVLPRLLMPPPWEDCCRLATEMLRGVLELARSRLGRAWGTCMAKGVLQPPGEAWLPRRAWMRAAALLPAMPPARGGGGVCV
jgi:hypothetical protein